MNWKELQTKCEAMLKDYKSRSFINIGEAFENIENLVNDIEDKSIRGYCYHILDSKGIDWESAICDIKDVVDDLIIIEELENPKTEWVKVDLDKEAKK